MNAGKIRCVALGFYALRIRVAEQSVARMATSTMRRRPLFCGFVAGKGDSPVSHQSGRLHELAGE
jgi:hypothetical protein